VSRKHKPERDGRQPGPWTRFWFTPEGPFGLHVLRVVTGSLVTVWLLTLLPDADALFGLDGWFGKEAFAEARRSPADVPVRFSWSLLYLVGGSPGAFWAFYLGSVGVLVLFTLGVAPRVTSVLSWLATLSLAASPVFDEEVEVLFRILTLYLAVGYVLTGPGPGASWTERVLGPWRTFLFARREGDAPPSIGANVALRLLQVHFAVLVVTSALHKLQDSAWWSGVAHWYKMMPPLEATVEQLRAMAGSGWSWLIFFNVTAYATLAWQLAFPMFAWRGGWWRAVLLGGAAVGWIGLAWLYRMPLFGPAFLAACLAYVRSSEWAKARNWLRALGGRMSASRQREAVTVGGG
jgi:hypothetical protein